MNKVYLKHVTLLGVDCVNLDRLILAAEICQRNFDFGDVKLLTSLENNHPNTIKIDRIGSVEEYSRFIITQLDNYVRTPHVLVFQYDGFILNPDQWTNEFLQYDYIGAPWLTADWSVKDFGFPEDLLGQYVVGNGGFSLRSKKLTAECKKLAEEGVITNYHPEDVVVCVRNRRLLESRGIKFAPVELAKQFSYEAEDDEHISWDGQFGFHGLDWTDISKWTARHPEYKINNPAANASSRKNISGS